MKQDTFNGSVIVIGSGISGLQASLSLANTGYRVTIIECSESPGGMMPDLYRTYPLCSCCKLDPMISVCMCHPNINIMLNTEITHISGSLGNFSISAKTDNESKTLNAGSIIIAAGIDVFDPSLHEIYAYGSYDNVVTSPEYEKILKSTGIKKGTVQKPSDGKVPGKIAWLQCVGSRDINKCDFSYCSSICCMSALKEAVNTKDFDKSIDTTIFYMDMRAHGKGFESYLNSAISKGVKLIRSRVHSVEKQAGKESLLIRYADENGEYKDDIFDMVVLSVGIRPAKSAEKVLANAGLRLNSQGFADCDPFKPVSTSIPGIYACGSINGPSDISQSISMAYASAAEICSLVNPENLEPVKNTPQIMPDACKPTGIIFAYDAKSLDHTHYSDLENYAEGIPEVAEVIRVEEIFSDVLTLALKSAGPSVRLVFATRFPSKHRPWIEESLDRAGLNTLTCEILDLRLINTGNELETIKERVITGVKKAALMDCPPVYEYPVEKSALVIGGGVSGLESALSIANSGYPVTLIERTKSLGGHGLHTRVTWKGHDIQKHLQELIKQAEEHPEITVMTETEIRSNTGSAGRFSSILRHREKDIEISHGAIIIAAGADPLKTPEYGYGKHEGVYLWSELSEKMIHSPSFFNKVDSAVFIQCVGSREPQCSHCSNLCCTFAVRSALDMKSLNPDMDIYILFRDIRTFGERENIYQDARRKGVIFIRYETDSKPVVNQGDDKNRLKVTVPEPVLGRNIVIDADIISLQTAIIPSNNLKLSETLKIDLDQDGFFAESPDKLKPEETSRYGIFMTGLAAYPKDTEESIVQSKAASARAIEILVQEKIRIENPVAEVLAEKCAVCCTCVRTCPFGIPYIDSQKGAAYIDPGLCRGCGICVAECPGKAIVITSHSDHMMCELLPLYAEMCKK